MRSVVCCGVVSCLLSCPFVSTARDLVLSAGAKHVVVRVKFFVLEAQNSSVEASPPAHEGISPRMSALHAESLPSR